MGVGFSVFLRSRHFGGLPFWRAAILAVQNYGRSTIVFVGDDSVSSSYDSVSSVYDSVSSVYDSVSSVYDSVSSSASGGAKFLA